MAKIDCDKIANMLATGLIAGDDDLAKVIADIALEKRVALARVEGLDAGAVDELTGLSAHELDLKAQSADIKLRAIVQAKILDGSIKSEDAYEQLVKQIHSEGGSLSTGIDLLEKVKNADPADLEKIVKLWTNGRSKTIGNTIKEIEDKISAFVSSNYSIREYTKETSKVGDIRKSMRNGKITKEEADKQIKKLKEEAYKKVKEGGNPSGLAKVDEEWNTIKKLAGDDKDKAWDLWSQYILAKEILADGAIDDSILEVFKNNLKSSNFVGDLTYDELTMIDSLDVLMSKAFLNTKQLCEDGLLRQKYRERLIELSSSMEMLPEDVQKIETLINTLNFSKQGISFSKVCEYNNALSKAKQLGYKVGDTTGEQLYNGLREFTRKIGVDGTEIPDEIIIAGIKFKPQDVVQLIYSVTDDKNILKILNAGNFTDDVALDIATKYFLGDDKGATKKIVALFTKAKQASKVGNVQDLSIKTITGVELKEGSPKAFYDFRDGLYIQNELNRDRANFQEQLANQNKMRISGDGITDLTGYKDEDELIEQLGKLKGGYLIVNDVKYRDNDILRDALTKVNKGIENEEEKIKVLFPRGAMSGNFRLEDGNLVFRTTSPDTFEDIAATISIQTLGEAKPTREISATASEMVTGKNADKLRYQASYNGNSVDSTGESISDQVESFFGGSVVRDDKGNLLRVYHGTRDKFAKFSYDKMGKNGSQYGIGFYFTSDSSLAYNYGDIIMDGFLDIRNPLRFVDGKPPVGTISNYEWRNVIREIANNNPEIYDNLGIDLSKQSVDAGISKYLAGGPHNDLDIINDLVKAAGNENALRTIKNVTGYDGVIADGGKTFIAFTPEQFVDKVNKLPTREGGLRYQTAYHGSPYKFSGFSTDHMGKGEGAQAHGWGLYFAEDRDVSEAYYVWGRGTGLLIDDERAGLVNEVERFGKEGAIVYEEFVYHRINHRGKPLKELRDDVIKRYKDDAAEWKNEEKVIQRQFNERYLKAKSEAERDALKDIYDELYASSLKYYEEAERKVKIANELSKRVDSEFSLYSVDIPDRVRKDTITGYNYFDEGATLTKGQLDSFMDALSKYKPVIDEKRYTLIRKWYSEGKERTGKDLYTALLTAFGGKRDKGKGASKFLEVLGYDGIEYIGERDGRAWVIFDGSNVKINDRTAYQRIGTVEGEDIGARNAVKLKEFKTKRTIQEIADFYGVPIKYTNKIVTPEGLQAYGAYGNGVIYFVEMVKTSTAPHELFHAIFNMGDKETYNRILKEASKYSDGNVVDIEEKLANAFAHYFNTGKFDYLEKELAFSTGLSKSKRKGFLNSIKEFFKTIRDYVLGIDSHRKEVKQMFDDMINMQYLPNNGKSINRLDAIMQYDNELENAANKYFGSMLGVSGEVTDKEYINRVHDLLSEKTGIPIEAFDNINDRAMLWNMVDDKFALEKLTAGKYDKVMEDVGKVVRSINGMSNDVLAGKIVEDLGGIVSKDNILSSDKLPQIRDAYIDFSTSASAQENLMAKGRILSLIGGGSAETMSMQDIKSMFSNGTFANVYKDMFFPNQELSEKDMKLFINEINNNIFDTLSIELANNLVNAGYSLPLVNIREVVYDFLNGSLDMNSNFISAFFAKNKIDYTKANLDTIINNFMPSELKFNYEDALYRIRNYDEINGVKSVFKQVNNRFTQDSYSSLAAMSSVRNGTVPQGYEEQILTSILDDYYEAFRKGLDEGLDFKKAQGIKQEASYALDMFEQDFILPRYGRFLTTSEKQGLMGMKYSLPIAVTGMSKTDALQEIEVVRNKLIQNYKRTLSNSAKNNDINMSIVNNLKGRDKKTQNQIAQREQALMEQGAVIKDIGGQYIVVDSREALLESLNTLPKNIRGFEVVKAAGKNGIDNLSNKQAYVLLKYVEAAKQANTITNYATELMYKQNPQLLKYDFFSSFKIDEETGIPKALNNNLLINNKIVNKLDNTSGVDLVTKQGIFKDIKSTFAKEGYVTKQDLDEIIKKNIDDNIQNLIAPLVGVSKETISDLEKSMLITYRNAFAPYQYVRDIPDGGKLLDGTKLTNVKGKIENLLQKQVQQVRASIKSAGITGFDDIEKRISIITTDGSRITLSDAMNQGIDGWKKNIFDDENMFVKSADEIGAKTIDPSKELTDSERTRLIKEEKKYREDITNEYNSTFQQIMNGGQIVTESERKLSTSIMNDVRTKLREYTLTNKLVDALDILSGINEEAARGIKDYLIGFMGQMTFGSWDAKGIRRRLGEVQEAYSKFYPMGIAGLNAVKPASKAEDLALKLAKYFKQLENQLGSADGLTGVTTKANINRAFYHIGEVFGNIKDEKGVFAMLSAIEQNQILKFFKFSNPNQDSYVKEFVRKGNGVIEYGGLGGYRDYVEEISGLTYSEFNDIFGSSFNESEFKQVLQGLTGFTLTGSWGRWGQQALNFLGGSHLIFRFLMSYPGQLLTIPQQGIAYFLKFLGHESEFGVESLSDVDKIREQAGVLNGAYNELKLFNANSINPDDITPNSFYNRYGLPDVSKVYGNTTMQYADDILSMYSKIDNYSSSNAQSVSWWFRQIDPYKDNANNIIDGLFARNFKNVAFTKALRENDFMQFGSAQAFKEFMEDATVSQVLKDRALDRISASAGRNFRNILGLGFGGIDRPIAGSTFGNIMYGLMQLFNFRGAWGQTIFKQTSEAIMTGMKMVGTSAMGPEGKTAVASYIANRPEFRNFIHTMLNDMVWCWKLTKYQDNGRRPEEDEYNAMDFLGYMTENLSLASQWWQGIQSFGPARPVIEAARSANQSRENPTIYKDTYGLGAFFNNLGKNFGRQWKVQNWIAKALGALTTDGWGGFMTYVENEAWKLSFGSLRYMMDEGSNAYGLTYEMTGQTGGIPGIIIGEASSEGDKTFSYDIDNTETWETIKQLFNGNNTVDEKWTYLGNLGKSMVNASQLSSLPKNVIKAINRSAPSYYTSDDLADVLLTTEAGKEFYSKGYVTPRTVQEAKSFIETMLANGKYRPGSESFNKSLMNFELFGHMNGKEQGNSKDAEMELWLEHMKYETAEDGGFIGGKKTVSPEWEALITNIKTYANDSKYVKNVIYNYAVNWLDNHQSDPNYQLYIKMLGQGQAVNLINSEEDKIVSDYNKYYGFKGTNKLTETEFKNSGLYYDMMLKLGNSEIPGEGKTLFDKLQVLDEDAATTAALGIIQSQVKSEQDKKTLEKFFNVKQDEDTGELTVSLRSQYKSQLMQIGAMGKAIDEGNVERIIAEASTLSKMYMNEDPTGLVTASLLDSVVNRINDTDSLSPKQKIEAISAVFHDNKEFIQANADKMRAVMGSDYDTYADYMNSILYQWDGKTISNILSMQANGDSGSGSGTKKGLKLSSDLKGLSQGIGGSHKSNSTTPGTTYKQWVPVKIAGASIVRELGVKGYVPNFTKTKFQGHKATVNLDINKDVNRKVSNKGTQSISSSKTLSKIEGKIEKASEGE